MSNSAHPAHARELRSEPARPRSTSGQIIHAVLSLASAALLIRVIGMANQIIVTSHFGAGARMDAYVVALSLPTLLAQSLTSVIQCAVTPTYARVRTHESREQISILFSTLLNAVAIGSALLVLLMLLFRRQMILLAAPALDPQREQLALALAPYIFPALLLMLVIGYLQSILNIEGHFGWPAYAGMLVPLATAAVVLTAATSLGVTALAVGTLIGLCLQLGVFILLMRRANITYRPVCHLRHPAIVPIVIAAWPLVFSETMAQASSFVDQIVASFLTAGSISALSYALKLISVPVGVIFLSVQRVALPHMSRQVATRDFQALKKTLHLNLWATGLVTAVLSVLLVLLAHPLVQILFQRGAFSATDTDRTAITLQGFAVGLVPMAAGFIVPDVFIALGKTKVLMYINIFAVVANAAFDFVLAHFWQSFGIALATSLVYLCSVTIKLVILRRLLGELHLFTPPSQLADVVRKAMSRA